MTEADLRHDSTHLSKNARDLRKVATIYFSLQCFLCAEEVRRTVFSISAEFNYIILSPKNKKITGPERGLEGVKKEGPCFVNTRILHGMVTKSPINSQQ